MGRFRHSKLATPARPGQAGAGEQNSFETGQTVFREGDSAESLFLVMSGILEVRSTRFVNAEQHPRLFPGSFFGELSLLAETPRSATVTALGRSEIMELRRDTLGELMERYPLVRERLQAEAELRRARDAQLSRPVDRLTEE